jgi:hypothetical protein
MMREGKDDAVMYIPYCAHTLLLPTCTVFIILYYYSKYTHHLNPLPTLYLHTVPRIVPCQFFPFTFGCYRGCLYNDFIRGDCKVLMR